MSTFSSDNVDYGNPSASKTTVGSPAPSLSHPPWTVKINRIPRAVRTSCRMLLIDIISRIISSPYSKFAWNELLLFTPAILSNPSGEAQREI